MNFVVVEIFSNYIDANIITGRLQAEDINCWLKDEHTVTIDPILTNAVGGIKLMVAEAQAERCIELLNQYKAEKQAAIRCPNCGSAEIQLVSTPRKPENWISAFLGFFLGDYAFGTKKVYHCFSCEKEYDELPAAQQEL